MEFKDWIYDYRTKCHMTKAEMADFLGVSPSAEGMWENGKRIPSKYWLEQISKLTSTDYDELLSIAYGSGLHKEDREFLKEQELIGSERELLAHIHAYAQNLYDFKSYSSEEESIISKYKKAPENIKLAIRSMLGIESNED